MKIFGNAQLMSSSTRGHCAGWSKKIYTFPLFVYQKIKLPSCTVKTNLQLVKWFEDVGNEVVDRTGNEMPDMVPLYTGNREYAH